MGLGGRPTGPEWGTSPGGRPGPALGRLRGARMRVRGTEARPLRDRRGPLGSAAHGSLERKSPHSSRPGGGGRGRGGVPSEAVGSPVAPCPCAPGPVLRGPCALCPGLPPGVDTCPLSPPAPRPAGPRRPARPSPPGSSVAHGQSSRRSGRPWSKRRGRGPNGEIKT